MKTECFCLFLQLNWENGFVSKRLGIDALRPKD